ncbi:hypothetical protein C2845_PM05G34250 [Panicum miliaceum]|uniref:Uncharacterized protein n=1 Tax=Panicum miliaceum TaxID=4540 RepID=A0A3L6T3Z3_PANMI|nr:hypothetical protein C2845_PM05G34250 [Panicum miliaceum]
MKRSFCPWTHLSSSFTHSFASPSLPIPGLRRWVLLRAPVATSAGCATSVTRTMLPPFVATVVAKAGASAPPATVVAADLGVSAPPTAAGCSCPLARWPRPLAVARRLCDDCGGGGGTANSAPRLHQRPAAVGRSHPPGHARWRRAPRSLAGWARPGGGVAVRSGVPPDARATGSGRRGGAVGGPDVRATGSSVAGSARRRRGRGLHQHERRRGGPCRAAGAEKARGRQVTTRRITARRSPAWSSLGFFFSVVEKADGRMDKVRRRTSDRSQQNVQGVFLSFCD